MNGPEGGAGRDLEIPLPLRRKIYVRLDDLKDPEGHPDGKRTRLKEPSAAVIRLGKQYDQDPEANAELLWDIAAALLPDLTAEEVAQLGYGTILRVLEIGRQPLDALEALAKNDGPPSA